jgi:hypothetical protein
MLMEDASKDPLMGGDDSESESSHWRHSTEFHPAQKNSAAKKLVICVLFVLPWTLLLWQGVWSWKYSGELKSRYYIRPELTYSKFMVCKFYLQFLIVARSGARSCWIRNKDLHDRFARRHRCLFVCRWTLAGSWCVVERLIPEYVFEEWNELD